METVIVCVWSLVVIETYVKECGVETVIVCFLSLVVIETRFKECGSGGDCHCLFLVSSGHRDLFQGVWQWWRLPLFVSGL